MDAKVLSSGFRHSNVPESYVRPESDRPGLSEVSECENIPVIDLASPNRAKTVQQIGRACKNYAFFQVINHVVSREGFEKMVEVANEFFSLPVEEKLKLYSDDPSKTMRLSTSFNVNKEKVHNWRDYLQLHCYPLDKDTVSNYRTEIRALEHKLQELISESLGLGKDYIKSILGEQGQHVAVPNPNALTILLQDPGVAGLQVLKDGKWVAVNPHPNAFVISVGDQLQATEDGFAAHCLVDSHNPQSHNQHSPEAATAEPADEGAIGRSGTRGLAFNWSRIWAQLRVWIRSLARFLAQLRVWIRRLAGFLAQVSVFLSWMISFAESWDLFAVIWPQVSVAKELLQPELQAMKTKVDAMKIIVDSVDLVLGWIENAG